jgi:putative tryptophan/tyrosine transport system substrate-binding protein
MRRREFISLLSGVAAAWPLAARAQQADRVRRVGVLMNVDDADQRVSYAAFLQVLQELGWTNVRIDTRWAGGSASEIRKQAAELVALAPDVIVASGTAGLGPLLENSRTVPIVFANVADPVGAGLSRTCRGREATLPALFSSNIL